MLLKLFTRFFAGGALAIALSLAPAVHAQGAAYTEINPPQPTDSPGKIEVLEFFAYTCPHCKALEPLLQSWARQLPSDVVVHQVPIAFNAGMKPLQQLYYSLEIMDRLDLHEKVFTAIHDEHKRLLNKSSIVDWAADQGLDRAKFEAVFDSFGVQSKVLRADQLAQAYHIDGTPTVAVNGRYITSPASTGGYQQTVAQADKLVQMARGN